MGLVAGAFLALLEPVNDSDSNCCALLPANRTCFLCALDAFVPNYKLEGMLKTVSLGLPASRASHLKSLHKAHAAPTATSPRLSK